MNNVRGFIMIFRFIITAALMIFLFVIHENESRKSIKQKNFTKKEKKYFNFLENWVWISSVAICLLLNLLVDSI